MTEQDIPLQCETEHYYVGALIDGRYELTDYVGKGGMACVYKGTEPGNPYPYALKFLMPHYHNQDYLVKFFEQEAENMQKLAHPNIVRFYRFMHRPDYSYIVMDYIEGYTVSKIIRRVYEKKSHIPEGEVVRIMVQVARALEAIHREGYVHRDVKPGNVLISTQPGSTGRTYLTDLGITSSMDMPIMGAGTSSYMAPELFEGGEGDQRTDIYACGIMLFEMLARRRPFVPSKNKKLADSADDIQRQHKEAPIPNITHYRPDLPSELNRVIHKALAKKPADRYQNVIDFARDMHTALHDLMPEDLQDFNNITYQTREVTGRTNLPVADDNIPDTGRPGTAPRATTSASRSITPLSVAFLLLIVGLLALFFLYEASNSQTLAITQTAEYQAALALSATDTPTITQTPTLTATLTPSSIPTDEPTSTLTPTDEPTQTTIPTDTPTATATLTSTATLTATVTASSTATDTPTATETVTPTYTLTPTVTSSSTPTATATLTATFTPSTTPIPTDVSDAALFEAVSRVALLSGSEASGDWFGDENDLLTLTPLYDEGFWYLNTGTVEGFGIRADITASDTPGGYGIVFGLRDSDNYWLLTLSQATGELRQISTGAGTQTDTPLDTFNISASIPYSFNMAVLETDVQLRLDDETVLRYQLPEAISGGLALYIAPDDDASVTLDNLQITAPDEALLTDTSDEMIIPAQRWLWRQLQAFQAVTNSQNTSINCPAFISIYEQLRLTDDDNPRLMLAFEADNNASAHLEAAQAAASNIFNLCENISPDGEFFMLSTGGNDYSPDFFTWEDALKNLLTELEADYAP